MIHKDFTFDFWGTSVTPGRRVRFPSGRRSLSRDFRTLGVSLTPDGTFGAVVLTVTLSSSDSTMNCVLFGAVNFLDF